MESAPTLRNTFVAIAALAASACTCVAGVGPGVDAGPGPQITISPDTVDVVVRGTVAFTATTTGAPDDGVTWSVQEAAGGTIDATGLYTAPTRSGTYHVVATGIGDTTLTGTATVNATSPDIKVAIGPHVVFLPAGKPVLFSGAVTGVLPGDPTDITWSVEESGGGTIDSTGHYVAPATAGEYHVVGSAAADVTKTDRATIRVGSAGLLPADRATIWNPGLTAVGGIPNRTAIFRTLAPSGADDTAAINAALAACPKDQVVKLGPGTFKVSGQGIVIGKSNVVLRGSGPDQTMITRTDTQDYPIIIIGTRFLTGKLIKPIALAANGVKGSYGVSLAAAPSPALKPGELVYLDSVTNPAVTHWGDNSPPGDQSRGWFSRFDRPVAQVLEVATASGTDVTFTTPLHIDFPTSFQAQLSRPGQGTAVDPSVQWSGVEDLYMEKGRGGDSGGNLHFFVAAYSWARNIESNLSRGSAVALDSSFRCEVRDSYIHTSANPNPGGEGYLFSVNQGAADNLIENNVLWSGNILIVMRASGGGNVVAYNYGQDAFGETFPNFIVPGLNAAHMTTAHYELFEGNESFNFDADDIWGNAAYVTVFRNNFVGLRLSHAPLVLQDQLPRRAIGLTRWSWFYTFIGNVLGTQGQPLVAQQKKFAYEAVPGVGSASGFDDDTIVPMWKLGYSDTDSTALQDPQTVATVLRHGNFDYFTNTVKWETSIASQQLPDSLYLGKKPPFFGNAVWPWVDPTAATPAGRTQVLPAKERFKALP